MGTYSQEKANFFYFFLREKRKWGKWLFIKHPEHNNQKGKFCREALQGAAQGIVGGFGAYTCTLAHFLHAKAIEVPELNQLFLPGGKCCHGAPDFLFYFIGRLDGYNAFLIR